MKKLVLFSLLLFSLISYSQKYSFNNCELMDNKGNLMFEWEEKCFVQVYNDFLIVESNNHKILDIISPSSMFDMSDFRLFKKIAPIIYMKGDSGKIMEKTVLEDTNFPSKVGALTDSLNSFFMFAPNPSVTLVIFNKRKKSNNNQ